MKSGILVYDIGTTSVKCAIFNGGLDIAASVSVPYKTEYPRPLWAEQNPELFWAAAVQGTKDLFAKIDGKEFQIEAIGLDGHMNGCLAVDANGQALYPELIHSDSRSSAQCKKIRASFGEDYLYRITANRTDEHLSLPKMVWIKENVPDAFNKTAYFINAKDYLRIKLCGAQSETATDYSDASLTGVFNLEKRDWAWDIIDALALGRERFPKLLRSVDKAGTLSKEAASLLGLKEGIPVAAGSGDASAATRGAGTSGNGQSYIAIGSSAWASILTAKPVYDKRRRMQIFFDLDGVSCNVCGTVQSAGAALDWAARLLYGQNFSSEQFVSVENELETLEAGSGGILFLPYLMGERTPHWDAAARGCFVGLSLSSDKNAALRAVYEGISYALKDIFNVYADLSLPVQKITLLGGASRSAFWQKMICNVIGIPLNVHPLQSHAIALGSAAAAGIMAGLFDNFDDAIKKILSKNDSSEIIIPDKQVSETYQHYFGIYKEIYPQMKKIFANLAAL
jgi:xylulokinase